MKRTSAPLFLLPFVFLVSFSYGQMRGGNPSGTSAAPPPGAGAYDPHNGPAGTNAPPPIEQRPQDYLAQEPKFSAKVQKMLPESLTPIQFCDGFKTLGDCVAAIHAAQNLEIPLADLKGKVTGKGSVNLEKGIHELKPDVDAKVERKKAWKQAEKDIPVSN